MKYFVKHAPDRKRLDLDLTGKATFSCQLRVTLTSFRDRTHLTRHSCFKRRCRPVTVGVVISLSSTHHVAEIGINGVGGIEWLHLARLHQQYSNLCRILLAASAVSYEPVVFSSGFEVKQSPFKGTPSEASNKLWRDIYPFGISPISTKEASLMRNKTPPVPDEERGYIIQPADFYQLHYLNLLRFGIYGHVDMKNQDELQGIEHLDHCIDMPRKNLMCSFGVTPLTFSTKLHIEVGRAAAEVVRGCRSFVDAQKWAMTRRFREAIDLTSVVAEDPLNWGNY